MTLRSDWPGFVCVAFVVVALAACVNEPPVPQATSVEVDGCTHVAQAISSMDASMTNAFARLDTEPAEAVHILEQTADRLLLDTKEIGEPDVRALTDEIRTSFDDLVAVVKDEVESGESIDRERVVSAIGDVTTTLVAAATECAGPATPDPTDDDNS